MRIITLNVNGIRSATTKGVVSWLAESGADVICLQEVRARMAKQFDQARRDLTEAFTIAERGEMRLHLADCYLEFARLNLATGDRDSARRAWETAQTMVDEMGYHRRDGEVAALSAELGMMKPE